MNESRANIDKKEIRCKKCRRLLLKGEIKLIEVKCPKCGYIQLIYDEENNKKVFTEEEMRK